MKIGNAVPAFVVALGGVAFAKIGFDEGWWVAFVIFLLPVVIVWPLDYFAREALLPKQPRLALVLMELWVLFPLGLAIAGAGAAIGIAVEFIEDPNWTPQEKELYSAIAAALTAFIATTFIKASESPDAEWLSDRARKAFFNVYDGYREGKTLENGKIYFDPPESPGERWVFSKEYGGIEGWTFKARHKRAQGVAKALKSGQYRKAT